ncbi:glutamine-tRNA ligase [Meredithblackwellia eburnea MCA 4105]
MTTSVEELTTYFQSCGLTPTRTSELVKNPKSSTPAYALFSKYAIQDANITDKQGMLLLQLVKDLGKLDQGEKEGVVVKGITTGELASGEQVTAAIKYLSTHPLPLNTEEYNTFCGIGFTITPTTLHTLLTTYLTSNSKTITSWSQFGKTQGLLKADEKAGVKWAPALMVKEELEKVFEERFGKRPVPGAGGKARAGTGGMEEKKVATASGAEAKAKEKDEDATAQGSPFSHGWISRLHQPGGNPQKIPTRMDEHLKWTGGKVFTRFPPEPNGFLHIGHSKAIAINFGYAAYHLGHCYLRFDDTNPEAEEQIYFDKMLEAVRWLGFEPFQVTYSSDHFERLYQLARGLIERGLAYTSDDTAEDIAAQRGGKDHAARFPSKDRNKPVSQSLQEFSDMRAGKYKPGEMTLRMKQDMDNPNPVMWDIIAYRVLEKPHHRTGTQWCIYPTYDFTHCLCDSFENISHSLCSSEFVTAREAYEWLCDALEVYKPRQSEYGRLSLEGTVTSKRKLLRLVKEGHVNGWDDPRLYTLVALKRRGVPPQAIVSFVTGLGISPSPSTIQISRFEQTVRQHLETTTARLMMVLRPIIVNITNLPSDFYLEIEKPVHPKNPAMGTNKVPFTNKVYIDADDFRPDADPNFFRLAPGATVGLLNVPFPITYVSHKTNDKGEVTSIECRYENEVSPTPKPKTWIQWVAEHAPSHSPVRVSETRIFKRLFKSDDPGSLSSEDFIKDIDVDTLVRVDGALLEVGIWKVIDDCLKDAKKVVEDRLKEAKAKGIEAPPQVDGVEVVRFQGLRVAYFALDYDSVLEKDYKEGEERKDKLVLNLIAPLKEDAGKKAVAGKK